MSPSYSPEELAAAVALIVANAPQLREDQVQILTRVFKSEPKPDRLSASVSAALRARREQRHV